MSEPANTQRSEIEIRVRYAETDAMGYLHHSRYFVYFEMGRTELLRQTGVAYREMEQRGLFYVVAKLEAKFKAPAHYDDVLMLATRVDKITPVRVEHRYDLMRGDRLLCEAASTLVLVGRDGRPQGLPDDLYRLLGGV
ncbi:MAG: acyl-CoA thioesterase [Phycisphaerales bacterium]|nr:acyl-CoA thioesterase [Phycisphaerales bacterium]